MRARCTLASLCMGAALSVRSVCAVPLCVASGVGSPGGVDFTNVTFPASGRSFLLATPPLPAPPLRLLYALHGYGDGAEFILGRTRFDASATAAGYVVVAPQGDAGVPGGSWSLGNGRTDGRQTDRVTLENELAFLWSITSCVRALGIPLSGDVYLAGLSQGGKMATRMACSTHEGFTGGLDPVVPFCTSGSFLYRPAAASLGLLARSAMNGCSAAPAVPRGGSRADVAATRVFEFQGCGAPTLLVWTPLDVHVWPGELPDTRQNGSAVALSFFASLGRDVVLPELKGSHAPWPCGQHWT